MLYFNEIKPVNPNGNQSWISIGRTVAEAEATILWPPNVKSQLIGKDPDARKDWRQKEKAVTEDEIDSITDSMDLNLSKLQEIVKDRGAWCVAVHGVAKSWTWLSDWKTTMGRWLHTCNSLILLYGLLYISLELCLCWHPLAVDCWKISAIARDGVKRNPPSGWCIWLPIFLWTRSTGIHRLMGND